MTSTALAFPCPHLATWQEQQRDPSYQACDALSGQPCRWARRYDGQTNPAFHSERLEQLVNSPGTPCSPDLLRETILDTGLV